MDIKEYLQANKKLIIAAAIALIIGIIIGRNLTGSQMGRYQVAGLDNLRFSLLDTSSGKLYRFNYEGEREELDIVRGKRQTLTKMGEGQMGDHIPPPRR